MTRRRESWNCEEAGHEGDRYNRRVEYVRADQRDRMATIDAGRICKDCARRDIEWRKGHTEEMNPRRSGLQGTFDMDSSGPVKP